MPDPGVPGVLTPALWLLHRALFEQRLELRQLAERGEIRVLLDMLEDVVHGLRPAAAGCRFDFGSLLPKEVQQQAVELKAAARRGGPQSKCALRLLLRALFEQRLELWQLAEWCEVRVLLDVLEVVVAGGDRFFQAGQR